MAFLRSHPGPLPSILVRTMLAALLGGAARPAAAAIPVCGTIGNATWSAGEVYVIDDCTVTVPAGATLRIEPGAVVKMLGWDWKLRVQGALVAEGTAEAPIVFTSLRDDTAGGDTNGDGAASQPRPNDWGLIAFESGGSGSLRHAFIGHGGYFSGFGLRAMVESRGGGALALADVTIAASSHGGLYVEGVSPQISRAAFVGNDGYGVDLNGLDRDVALAITASHFVTSGAAQRAGRIVLGDHPPTITLTDNRAEGPGWNGFVLEGDVIRDLTLASVDSVPLISETRTVVAAGATLAIAPGAVFKFRDWDWRLLVRGELVAEGTAEAPIVFTSLRDDSVGGDTNGDGAASQAAPNDWGLIAFESGGNGSLRHAFVRYGGRFSGFGLRAMVESRGGGDVRLEDVTITASSGDGVYVEEADLLLRGRVFGNAYGARNGTPSRGLVDARAVWWGDATGPLHPGRNPQGVGDDVSDGVLFAPWAVDAEGTVPTQVRVLGPGRVSPGETAQYELSYYAGSRIDAATLVLVPPRTVEVVDATGGGLDWRARGVFVWRLGDLPAGSEGAVSARLRYDWGLASDSAHPVMALLDGSNVDLGAIEPDAEILAFTPDETVSEQVLNAARIDAALAASADLRSLFDDALAGGSWLVGGANYRFAVDDLARTELTLGARGAVEALRDDGGVVTALRLGPATSAVHSATGGLVLDLATRAASASGGWAPALQAVRGGIAGEPDPWPTGRCVYNCVVQAMAPWGGYWLAVSRSGRGGVQVLDGAACAECRAGGDCAACLRALREIATPNLTADEIGDALHQCRRSCEYPSTCHESGAPCDRYHRCPQPDEGCVFDSGELTAREIYGCERHGSARIEVCVESWLESRSTREGGQTPIVAAFACNPATGAWEPEPRFSRCPIYSRCLQVGTRALCLGGHNCLPQGQPPEPPQAPKTCSLTSTTVRVARDPNAKYGPAGDVLAGETVSYTVEYENVGAGRAFGVYVTDALSPHLDEATLDLGGDGRFLPATRTILWEIGELAAQGEPGSKGTKHFTIQVRAGTPVGTVLANQAVVYFPSVPEETATNAVVNVVQAVVAEPQQRETTYGVAIPIALAGRAAGGGPLSFAVGAHPVGGALGGTPPDLTYTPGANFTGQDRFTFTASDGVSISRPAAVTILVAPSAADTTAPEVTWTYPEAGAEMTGVTTDPVATDETGDLYGPSVRAGFSEAMDPLTVAASALAVTDAAGRTVPAAVTWDGVARQAVLTPRAAWRTGAYRATVGGAAADASGNPLAGSHTWSFRIGPAAACPGDCNGDGAVTIDELIRGVNIALGTAALATCPPFDGDGDGAVAINELIAAVNRALAGC